MEANRVIIRLLEGLGGDSLTPFKLTHTQSIYSSLPPLLPLASCTFVPTLPLTSSFPTTTHLKVSHLPPYYSHLPTFISNPRSPPTSIQRKSNHFSGFALHLHSNCVLLLLLYTSISSLSFILTSLSSSSSSSIQTLRQASTRNILHPRPSPPLHSSTRPVFFRPPRLYITISSIITQAGCEEKTLYIGQTSIFPALFRGSNRLLPDPSNFYAKIRTHWQDIWWQQGSCSYARIL